ncbi:hypothetical protein TIFTF001_034651 [Ficus carica]|uniref:Uncharacterized protein n=1 Tax=Ficus carica TaxID=3494 RepID=A0AA88J5E9_FICCA|nr:hypothetical protein TIFTF001_034651 [Ficus carica]
MGMRSTTLLVSYSDRSQQERSSPSPNRRRSRMAPSLSPTLRRVVADEVEYLERAPERFVVVGVRHTVKRFISCRELLRS